MGKKKNKKVLSGAAMSQRPTTTAEEITTEVAPKGPTIEYCNDIAVEVDEEVYAKIMHWIDKAPGEVSGLGKVELVNGLFRVTSAILLKQENTSVTTDIDAAAVGKAMFELKDAPGAMNWWWHSHVNMSVFWSGTDLDTIHQIGNNGWCLATVYNKKRESRSCYFQKGTQFIPSILVDDIPTRTIFLTTDSTIDSWDKEFDDKVETKKFQYVGSRGSLPGLPLLPGNGGYRHEDNIIDASLEGYRTRIYDEDMPGKPWYEQEDEDRIAASMMGEDDDLDAPFDDGELQAMIQAEIHRQIQAEKGGKKKKKSGAV